MPANIELSDLEATLVNAMSREVTLRTYVNEAKKNYDVVLIDCMPSLGMITINALATADSVIIPVQAHYLPAKGMTQLIKNIARVKKRINPALKVDGVLLTLVDGRTNLARQTAEILRHTYGSVLKIYRSEIPVAIKAAETSAAGKSIYAYDNGSKAAQAYACLLYTSGIFSPLFCTGAGFSEFKSKNSSYFSRTTSICSATFFPSCSMEYTVLTNFSFTP